MPGPFARTRCRGCTHPAAPGHHPGVPVGSAPALGRSPNPGRRWHVPSLAGISTLSRRPCSAPLRAGATQRVPAPASPRSHSPPATSTHPARTPGGHQRHRGPVAPPPAPALPPGTVLPGTLLPCGCARALVCAFTASTPRAGGLKDFPIITTKSLPGAVSRRPGPSPRCRAARRALPARCFAYACVKLDFPTPDLAQQLKSPKSPRISLPLVRQGYPCCRSHPPPAGNPGASVPRAATARGGGSPAPLPRGPGWGRCQGQQRRTPVPVNPTPWPWPWGAE